MFKSDIYSTIGSVKMAVLKILEILENSQENIRDGVWLYLNFGIKACNLSKYSIKGVFLRISIDFENNFSVKYLWKAASESHIVQSIQEWTK